MIIKKTLKEMIEELGGLADAPVKFSKRFYIGYWEPERLESQRLTGATDSEFDRVSADVMRTIKELDGAVPNSSMEGVICDIFEEALANAVEYGNHYDKTLPVRISIMECREAYILRIKDQGNGFNPEKPIFHHLGEGFWNFENMSYPISFTNSGTAFNMAIPKLVSLGRTDEEAFSQSYLRVQILLR